MSYCPTSEELEARGFQYLAGVRYWQKEVPRQAGYFSLFVLPADSDPAHRVLFGKTNGIPCPLRLRDIHDLDHLLRMLGITDNPA